ncbi:hypothetical protein [Ramlibacter sp. PS4R-6]|uniref:hypothetical protein n=1 Tax=Ramlibacter sp. PS4R-6 TaxID=3133438 RepID=UPI0030ABFEE9
MIGLRKLLQRDPPVESPETEVDASGHSADEIQTEYRSIILDQLVRGGVAPNCVELEVRPSGRLKDGRTSFVGMLRLVHWERSSAVRLLLGLPILESRVRRMIRGSWLREVSQFGGVWLHASGQLQDSRAMEDLRMLVLDIEKREHDSHPPSGSSVWTVPTDLGSLPDR